LSTLVNSGSGFHPCRLVPDKIAVVKDKNLKQLENQADVVASQQHTPGVTSPVDPLTKPSLAKTTAVAGTVPSEATSSGQAQAIPHSEPLGGQLLSALASAAVRQFRFPKFLRGLTEALLFCGIYLVAGEISLGMPLVDMLSPMVPVVLLMMFCMVASGVYRQEITNSILNLYIHSIYGFFLASVGLVLLTLNLPPEYSQSKFIFFFLFFAFFVMNTMRPIISGTDFMDGGGRRKN